jgi:hypothetical protein
MTSSLSPPLMPLFASLSTEATRLENTRNSCAVSRRNSNCTEEGEQDEEEGTLQGRTSSGFSSPVKEEEENNDDALEEKEWKEETGSGRAALDWSMQTQLNSDWSVPARLNSLLAWQQISSMPANLAPSPNTEQATSNNSLLQSSRNGSPPIESAAMESDQYLFRKRNPLASFFHPASICASSPASFRASGDLNDGLPSSSEEQNNGGVLSLDGGRNFSSNRAASSYGATGSFSSGAHMSKQLLHQPKCLGSDLSTMMEFRHTLSRPPFTYVSLIRQVWTP